MDVSLADRSERKVAGSCGDFFQAVYIKINNTYFLFIEIILKNIMLTVYHR